MPALTSIAAGVGIAGTATSMGSQIAGAVMGGGGGGGGDFQPMQAEGGNSYGADGGDQGSTYGQLQVPGSVPTQPLQQPQISVPGLGPGMWRG